MGDPHDGLLRLLRTGRTHALSADKLAGRMGLSPRVVGKLVEELRERGELIGSSCEPPHNGYFLCATFDDYDVGTRHIRARFTKMRRQVEQMDRRAATQFGNQTSLLEAAS